MKNQEILYWPVAKLRPDENNPRRIKSDTDIRLLADNIKQLGIINPIEVQEDGTIVTGESRWRAAKIAHLDTVPVKVVGKDELANLKLRQVSENLHRSEMNPMDVAQEILATKARLKLSYSQLAKHYNLAQTTVQTYCNLVRMPDFVTKEVAKGTITWAKAAQMSYIKDEGHMRLLLDGAKDGRLRNNRAVQLAGIYLRRGGDMDKLKEFIKDKPTDSQLQKMVDESGVGHRLRTNVRSGNRIISLATELALALKHAKPGDIAALQLPRLALALTTLEEEANKWIAKQDKNLLK